MNTIIIMICTCCIISVLALVATLFALLRTLQQYTGIRTSQTIPVTHTVYAQQNNTCMCCNNIIEHSDSYCGYCGNTVLVTTQTTYTNYQTVPSYIHNTGIGNTCVIPVRSDYAHA